MCILLNILRADICEANYEARKEVSTKNMPTFKAIIREVEHLDKYVAYLYKSMKTLNSFFQPILFIQYSEQKCGIAIF